MRTFHSVAQGRLASFQNAATSDPIGSDPMSVGCTGYTSATAEPKDNLDAATSDKMVSDPMSVGCTGYISATAEPKDDLDDVAHAQREAADAKRKWLKMQHKLRQ